MNPTNMYKKSELLYRLKNKYNLKEKMKLSLEFINYISEQENIDIKDLTCILQINSTTMWGLKNKKHKFTILRFDKFNGINNKILINKEKISYDDFNELKDILCIKDYTLIGRLGISKYNYYKMKEGEISKVRIKAMKVKHIVDLIKIDIKYLGKYKSGYYSVSKLIDICKSRKINLDQFLKYFNSNYRHYKFNKMIIEKNKNGFGIGEESKIPDEFINNNYDKLMRGLKKVANKVGLITGCKNLMQDCVQEAMLQLYEKSGNILKNFYFDMKVVYNILMVKAKYIMFGVCRKNYKMYNEKYIKIL